VTLNAMRAVEAVEKASIKGAIVECGVWRGGVSMAMMHQLKKFGSRRQVFLYDTYDGMSEPTSEDRSPEGEAASKLLAVHKKDEANHFWAFAPIDRVRRNIESVGYPMEWVRMIQGKVEDTMPGVIPESIALLRLDTDWYESTRHELIHLYPRLVSGGVLILDDYGFWQGARKAVDEFFETLREKPLLHVVHDDLNSCVRWCIKP
jgi:O-methyltransferase